MRPDGADSPAATDLLCGAPEAAAHFGVRIGLELLQVGKRLLAAGDEFRFRVLAGLDVAGPQAFQEGVEILREG